jgi:hypothetical protein
VVSAYCLSLVVIWPLHPWQLSPPLLSLLLLLWFQTSQRRNSNWFIELLCPLRQNPYQCLVSSHLWPGRPWGHEVMTIGGTQCLMDSVLTQR